MQEAADKQICALIFKSVHLIVYTYHTATEPGHIVEEIGGKKGGGVKLKEERRASEVHSGAFVASER